MINSSYGKRTYLKITLIDSIMPVDADFTMSLMETIVQQINLGKTE